MNIYIYIYILPSGGREGGVTAGRRCDTQQASSGTAQEQQRQPKLRE